MEFIDAHSHIWTPDTERYPLTAGYRRLNMAPPSFTAEQLQQHMRPVGVNRVVLIQMSFYGYDNSYMLDSIRAFPGMFSGVAVIDQDGPRP
ncbi:MAG: amidohydrolase family protein, partial [Planctomycetaceae bacterium]